MRKNTSEKKKSIGRLNILVLSIVVFLFTACSDSLENSTDASPSVDVTVAESTPIPTLTPTAEPTPEPTEAPVADPVGEVSAPGNDNNFTYVFNTSTQKIHHSNCNSVPKIKPENYATTDKSIDELLNEGYTKCGNCW